MPGTDPQAFQFLFEIPAFQETGDGQGRPLAAGYGIGHEGPLSGQVPAGKHPCHGRGGVPGRWRSGPADGQTDFPHKPGLRDLPHGIDDRIDREDELRPVDRDGKWPAAVIQDPESIFRHSRPKAGPSFLPSAASERTGHSSRIPSRSAPRPPLRPGPASRLGSAGKPP